MKLSVVAASGVADGRPEEALDVALLAERLGYGEVWIGEGPTWDGFVLATAVGLTTNGIAMTVGPVPTSVRDPFTIARAAADVTALTGRTVGVALGTSSTRVVEGLHGRSRARAVSVLAETAKALSPLFAGRAADRPGAMPSPSLHRRLPSPTGPLTVAAFGERAIAVAAAHADRMVLDLVSPEQVATVRAKLDAAAAAAGRQPPSLAAWLPAGVDPDRQYRAQVRRTIAGYLGVAGYREMFRAAGFGAAVRLAQTGAGLDELQTALPPHAEQTVGLLGDISAVRARLADYAAAGLDEVAVVAATGGDPAGARTLTALSRLAGQAGRETD